MPRAEGRHRSALRWAARLAVVVVLAVLLARFGATAFLDGIRPLTPGAVLGALLLTAVATLAAAWRWTALASAFGDPLPLRAAVPAYSRSQLLNTVLPGGVTGDVARGLGGAPHHRLRRLKAVAWDRGTGQAVQLVLLAMAVATTVPALVVPVGVVSAAVAAAVAAVLLLGRRPERPDDRRVRRLARTFRTDLRTVLGRPGALIAVVAGSMAVALAHAAVFVLAAATTGTPPDLVRLVPLALAVQAATLLPSGFGGLGAREGAAAALFAGAGLGAAHGVAAGVAAGALALLAVLPGVVPLVADRLPRRTTAAARARHAEAVPR